MQGTGVVRLAVFSNGSAIDDAVEVFSVSVAKKVNRIPRATLVLRDGDMPGQDFPLSNTDTFKPGSEVEVKAGYTDADATIFKGLVVRHGIKVSGNNESRLVVECRDASVAMTVGRKNANFTDSSDSDAISQLISNYPALSADVTATDTHHTELVQYYASDWDFILSRAEANALLVVVDDGKFAVQPPATDKTPVLTVTYGKDLIEVTADVDARDQFAQVQSASWDPDKQAVVEEPAGPETLTGQGNLSAAELAKVIGLDTFRLQTAAPMETSGIKAWAKAQQLKAGLARIRGRVKIQGNAAVKIGTLIELAGVGKRFEGKAMVSAAHHDIADGNWLTDIEFGMSPDWFAEQRDLAAPLTSGLAPGIEGLHIGVVKKLQKDPDGQYRIQVVMPLTQTPMQRVLTGVSQLAVGQGLSSMLTPDLGSVWARLATFHASDDVGAFFLPEIGDEVVLGFLNNDPAHPVVLGSLYSGKHDPPCDMADENDVKAIVTREKLKLEFDEAKKVITLITPGENKVVIDDENKSILLQDQNGNKVALSPDGIVLDSAKDVKITAKGEISVSAMGKIDVGSQADVSVAGVNIDNEAKVGFTAKGNASAELSASGQTTVKGAMVMIN